MNDESVRKQAEYFSLMSDAEIKDFEIEVLRKIADLALVPPKINTSPLPDFDYDKLKYGMTPALTRTPRGRFWNIWFGGEDGPKAFLLANTSDDDGKTWSKPRLVINTQSEHLPLPRSIVMGHIWCDPDGKLRLFFSQSMMHFDGRASTWESVCENPDSDNPTWSKPRWVWHGGVHNKPIVRKNGEWLLPLDLEIDGYGFYSGVFSNLDNVRGMHVFASVDRGKTWQRRGHTVPQGVNHYAEHMVVERSDASLWMLIRTDAGLMESISTDDGWTWSEPTFTKTIKQPCSRFFITKLVSGRLMLVKHGNTVGDYIETEGLPDCETGRNRLTAFLSDNNGITWQGGLMLDERQTVSYPDGFQAPDGNIYIAYDHNRATDAEILMAKFTEEDILAGKLVSPESILKCLICKPSA